MELEKTTNYLGCDQYLAIKNGQTNSIVWQNGEQENGLTVSDVIFLAIERLRELDPSLLKSKSIIEHLMIAFTEQKRNEDNDEEIMQEKLTTEEFVNQLHYLGYEVYRNAEMIKVYKGDRFMVSVDPDKRYGIGIMSNNIDNFALYKLVTIYAGTPVEQR